MSDTAIATIPEAQLTRLQTVEAITTIETAEGEVVAVDGLAFVQTLKRNVDKARRELVDPLNAKVKEVNDAFRPMTDRLTTVEDATKKAIADWRRRERDRIVAEQRRVDAENAHRERLAAEETERKRMDVAGKTAREALDAGFTATEAIELARLESADVPVPAVIQEVAPAAIANTTKATLGSAVGRMVWKFEITDDFVVPRAYMAVDHAKIRLAMNNGVRDIPGVRFYEEEQIAGRRAS